ncbi:NUDIX domain-containing protein [Arthrobacter sp. zg-ZUI100]|nr:NUDIX domain-containing protein [Arthrobacter jiangjiafuii]
MSRRRPPSSWRYSFGAWRCGFSTYGGGTTGEHEGLGKRGRGCEPGQSFRTAAVAELFEETGIVAKAEDLEPFASLSDPSIHPLTYPNGDQVQAFAICFVLANWEGSLSAEESEVSDLGFFPLVDPPSPTHAPTTGVFKQMRRRLRDLQHNSSLVLAFESTNVGGITVDCRLVPLDVGRANELRQQFKQ